MKDQEKCVVICNIDSLQYLMIAIYPKNVEPILYHNNITISFQTPKSPLTKKAKYVYVIEKYIKQANKRFVFFRSYNVL